jgi:hypothetical protein
MGHYDTANVPVPAVIVVVLYPLAVVVELVPPVTVKVVVDG